jgi:alpha-N-acetylglucosaminidase
LGYSVGMFWTQSLRFASLLIILGGRAAAAQTSAGPAEAVLRRVMPQLAPQFQLRLRSPGKEGDSFRVSGTAGHIRVEGATLPTLLYGVNWYLKYVARLQVSPNGMQLGRAGMVLPGPQGPIERPALYRWRYALNENVDGYSTPYWSEARWRREIDVLALAGTNALLIERGADLVLYQTFRDAGYSDGAIRHWITQPAHQNWQLMGNMCCFIEPISMELLQKRAESAKKLLSMLRELGITPVLPGYYGIVPADFATLHNGAHVVTQGDWNGFTRPGWIDPRDPNFAILAKSFYRHQRDLFGDSVIYDMEIFQEGGAAGDVPVGEAAKRIQAALEEAHPGALWMMMGWQDNPMPAVMEAVDTRRVLVADIEQGRLPREDRDREFRGAQWLYGGLWEFGGRTTLGAPLYDYAVRMPKMAKLPGSRIVGTALFPEGLDTNPFAFDLYTEMAWHSEPVDLSAWTDEYSVRRYGREDAHAKRAWQIILKTAYGYRADGNKDHGERDAAHDSLFSAQPSLATLHAATWSPDVMRYRAEDLQPALTELLQVVPELRTSETYHYDLVDVARQVMANESRSMLPQIKAAYDAGDRAAFAALTARWLHRMQLLDSLLQTNDFFLLGRWLQFVPAWASSPAELAQVNYDARSILTTWGDRKASEFGLHEYANRDWAGLTADYYMPRWKMFFDTLAASLDTKSPPQPVDWYAFGDAWNRRPTKYAASATGQSYAAALAIARDLKLAPQIAGSR